MAYDSIHTGTTIDNAVTKATDMPGFKPEVANYASLPGSPTTGDVYLVIAATAGYPAGFYRYSGSAWVFMGREAAPVDSVNTQTGAVVLDADDIDDTSTTNKFTNSSDISRLSAVEAGAQVNTVDSVNTQTGTVVLDADDISDATTTNKFTNAADISRLSAVEAGADVTDTDNVTAAGALMDSEVTNLAQVKAFDSSDYATAAQGATADSAMQDLSDDTTPSLGGPLDVAGQDIVTSSNGDIEIDPDGSGVTIFKGNATKGSGQFKLNCENNSHGITIKGPPHSAGATYTLTLPDDVGSASQTLTTDGSGNLSWSTPAGSYGDSDVDAHLNTSSASTDQVLSWNGSDYAWVDQSGGGGSGGTSDRIISIDAGALVARTTNGAATATEEYATNDVMSDHFLFDGATEEGVQFRFHLPSDWDGNAVNAKFYWDAATGATAGDGVTWGIAMQAFQNDDALDNAFGTSVDTDDTVTAVGDLHVTALSTDITIAGSPSAGDLVIAEITRVVGDANDTMTEDAKLVGVTIHYTATAAVYDGQLGITIDGAGSVISTGSKGFLRVPYDCTITAAQLLADQSGSIVIDVTKDTYANFPPTTLTDSICASALPTLSSSQKSEDSTLTGWTTSLSKGDILGFVVDSATTVTRVTLTLAVTKG